MKAKLSSKPWEESACHPLLQRVSHVAKHPEEELGGILMEIMSEVRMSVII
ncbi:MAG: hypothetical protein PHW87_13635 [Methanothrix sp.]|nr:hypothetical protein [Methanothrix sp.]